MLLTEVILRLRQECSVFERRVGGTAKFSIVSAMDDENIGVPCAFVMPMSENAAQRKTDDATDTEVTERFSIIVCVSNRQDRSRGKGVSALEQLANCRQELYNAMVGWRPALLHSDKLKFNMTNDKGLDEEMLELLNQDLVQESSSDTFSYMGGEHLAMSPARIWHQYEFAVTYSMDKTKDEPAYDKIRELYLGMADDIGLEHIDDYDLIYNAANGGWDIKGDNN